MKLTTAIDLAYDLATRIAHDSALGGLDLALHTLEIVEEKHGAPDEVAKALRLLMAYYNEATTEPSETHGY